MRKMDTGPIHSGLIGHRIPDIWDEGARRRFLNWLNNVQPPTPTSIQEAIQNIRLYDRYDSEDLEVRKKLTSCILPMMRNIQTMPFDDDDFVLRGAKIVAEHGGDANAADSYVWEELGFNDNARLNELLQTYTVISTVPSAGDPSRRYATGESATEAWAFYMLMLLTSSGKLDTLKLCNCGCGIWFIARRSIDRFAADGCRVRFHQANADFKAKRNKSARERYRDDVNCKFVRGWRNQKPKETSDAKAAK